VKKSTANQPYAIDYRGLIITMAVLLIICEIFSRNLKIANFRSLSRDCKPLSDILLDILVDVQFE